MTNNLEISGSIKKTVNTTEETSVTINPSKTFTEYTQLSIKVGAGATESVSLGGISSPTFLYAETDNAVTFKSYRGASVIASALPVDTALLINGNTANRFGTVSLTNGGVSDAVVDIYMSQ